MWSPPNEAYNMESNKDQELIQKYLDREATPQEVAEVEQRLQHEGEFSKLYRELKVLPAGIRYHALNDKLQQLRALETELQSSLKTYLFGIGKNLVMQEYRKNMRSERVKAEYILQSHLLPTPDEAQAEVEDLSLIARCFERIGDPFRRLLEFFYFHQKNMEEISSELGYKNPETAKNQKYKCMERLRKLVEGERPTSFVVATE